MVFDDGMVVRVRLPQVTPVGVALGLAFVIPILAMLVVGLTVGSEPPLHTMIVVWSVVVSLVLLACLCEWLRILSGRWDLVIDRAAGIVRLPRSQGRKEEIIVPLANVLCVELETVEFRKAKGGSSVSYAPVVLFVTADEQPQVERLVIWLREKLAQALVDWLSEQIRKATHQ